MFNLAKTRKQKKGKGVEQIMEYVEPAIDSVVDLAQRYIYKDPVTGKPFDMKKYREEQEFNDQVRRGEIKLEMDNEIFKNPKKFVRDLDAEMEEYKKKYGNGRSRRKRRGGKTETNSDDADDEEIDMQEVIDAQKNQIAEMREQIRRQKIKNFETIKPMLDERGRQIKDELLYLNHGYRPKKITTGGLLPEVAEVVTDVALQVIPSIINGLAPKEDKRLKALQQKEQLNEIANEYANVREQLDTANNFDYKKAKPLLQKQTDTVMKNLRAMHTKKRTANGKCKLMKYLMNMKAK